MNKEYEQKLAADIRSNYVKKEVTKLDELRKLDEKASRPANIFAYSFGTAGALVFGVGMCLAMKVIGNLMPLGVVIGVLGIAMVSANYALYKVILKKNRKKYEKKVLELSDELLNENQ